MRYVNNDYTLFLKEPVKLRFKLAVLNFSEVLRVNCF